MAGLAVRFELVGIHLASLRLSVDATADSIQVSP